MSQLGVNQFNKGGRDRYVVVRCGYDFLCVLDLDSMTLIPSWQGFEKIPAYCRKGRSELYEIMAYDISPDETHVVYTSGYTNEIVFADFNGNRLRSIPPDDSLRIRSINFSADGRFIYYISGSSMFFVNSSTLQEEDRLEHTNDLTGAQTVDMVTVVTIAEDNDLRVWDRSRDKKRTTNRQARTLAPIDRIEKCFPLGHQDALFVTGSAGKDSSTIVGLYDAGRLEYRAIRELERRREVDNEDAYYIAFYEADNRSVVMEINRKLFLFDLEKMDVSIVFPGIVSSNGVRIVTKRKQLLVTSRGGKNVKLYNIANGGVDAIIKTGHNKQIYQVAVNDPGTLAAVTVVFGPVVLMDLVTHSRMYEISDSRPYGETLFASYMLFTRDSSRLFFSGGYMGERWDDEVQLFCWDIEQKIELFEPCDRKVVKMVKADVYRLDDDRIITTGFRESLGDNIDVRVYDVKTGKLLQRLVHKTSVKLALSDVTPYFLTYGSESEENCIFLWDKVTCSRVATFTLDEQVNTLHWSADGTFFYTISNYFWKHKVPDVITWTIHHGNQPTSTPWAKRSPPLYSTEANLPRLTINAPECVFTVYQPEAGDPDTDDEVFDYDSSESDDEDK